MSFDVLQDQQCLEYARRVVAGENVDDLEKGYENLWEPDQWMRLIIQFLKTVFDAKQVLEKDRTAAAAYYYYFINHCEEFEGNYEKAIDLGNVKNILLISFGLLSRNIVRDPFKNANYNDIVAYTRTCK